MSNHILLKAYGFPTDEKSGNPFLEDIARALITQGNEVTVMLLHPIGLKSIVLGNTDVMKQPILYEKRGLRFINVVYINALPKSSMTSRWIKRFIIRKTIQTIRNAMKSLPAITLLQHHYILNSDIWLSDAISQQLDVPMVVFEHSPSMNEQAIQRKLDVYLTRKQLNRMVQNAAARIARTNLYKKQYEDLFNAQFDVLPSFVPQKLIDRIDTQSDQHKSGFTFTAIGTFSERKNHRLAIEAFLSVFAEDPNVSLEVIGEGPLFDEIQTLINEKEMLCNISLPGRLPKKEVLNRMKNSDVVLSTSRAESFGNTIIEGMALGKPVISTRSGGPEEILGEAPECGILVGHTVDSVSDAMRTIHASYASFDADKIKFHFQKNYSEERVMARLNRIYDSIKG